MKSRLKYLALFFAILLAFFLLGKIVFMLYNSNEGFFTVADILSVLWHGLPLDLSTVSYLTIFPWLLCLLSTLPTSNIGPYLSTATKYYSLLISPLLALIIVADTVLYKFWQFKLDATIFNYIDSPTEAIASVSLSFVLLALLATGLLTALLVLSLRRVWRMPFHPVTDKVRSLCILVVIGGVMFLLIRGGVGRSTMNVGRVYYSSNQFLNHSAVNPAFSLLSSSLKVQKFDKLYRFYDRETGMAEADYICLHDEVVDDSQPLEICDPQARWKRKLMENFQAVELQVPVFQGGKLVYELPTLKEIKTNCAYQVSTLWPEVKRFDYPHEYYVDLSENLMALKDRMLAEHGRKAD